MHWLLARSDPDIDLSPIMSDYQCDKGTLRWVLNNCQQLHDEQVNAEMMAIDLSKPNTTTALSSCNSVQDYVVIDDDDNDDYEQLAREMAAYLASGTRGKHLWF